MSATHPCPWVWVSISYPLIHLSGCNHLTIHLPTCPSIPLSVSLSIHLYFLYDAKGLQHTALKGVRVRGFISSLHLLYPSIYPSIHPITLPEPPIYFLHIELCVHFPVFQITSYSFYQSHKYYNHGVEFKKYFCVRCVQYVSKGKKSFQHVPINDQAIHQLFQLLKS